MLITINQGSKRHIQNTPPNDSRIHISFEVHGTFTKTDHILGHKINLNKFKGT